MLNLLDSFGENDKEKTFTALVVILVTISILTLLILLFTAGMEVGLFDWILIGIGVGGLGLLSSQAILVLWKYILKMKNRG